MSIETNIAAILENIAYEAKKAGRNPADISLCAATKHNDYQAVQTAIASGVDCCGENRVQEFLEKSEQNAYMEKPIHFIGRLQTNKVKFLVGNVDIIQSVDRLSLLQQINKEAEKKNIQQSILLEVNIGNEASKSGFLPNEIWSIMDEIGQFSHIFIRGLMAIPPISHKVGSNRIFFQQMFNLFVDIREKKYDNGKIDCLSMGMSGDYADAIAEGSTMIRLGTAIFGPRNYNL